LIYVLDSLIQYEEKNDSLFALGYGYISVDYSTSMSYGPVLPDNTRVDTVFQYDICFTYMHPEEEINKLGSAYPSYYSLVRNRVVKLGDGNVGRLLGFSEGSTTIYMKILNPLLPPQGHANSNFERYDEVVHVYYLENRFTGRKERPVVVRQKIF